MPPPGLLDPAVEQRVLAAIDETEVLDDLRQLVAIPSVDGTPAEAEVQRWGAQRLRSLGLEVDEWDIDVAELTPHDDFPGMEVERSRAVGCVGVLPPSSSDSVEAGDLPALALYGHTDVVPPGDLARWPGRDPFTLRVADGLAWGRGACDMKAGVAAVLGAVAAVRRCDVAPARPLAVHLVSAEEDGGLGAYATVRRGHLAAACVSTEPTSGQLVPANAGALTFRLAVSGRATHGSTRARGVSAIEVFERVHAGLRRLEERRNAARPVAFEHLDLPWPLSVGILRAGDWASTVPDLLVAEGRYGVRSDETVSQAQAEFEAAVAEVGAEDRWLREHPVRITWPGGRFAPGALPEEHPLLDSVREAVADVTGATPVAAGAPYGSDLRHYAAAGVPTLQYGPGDVRYAHASDEHVRLAEVFTCARVYALLALRLCGVS